MGFHHVGQAGLELLTSGDQPASVSQSAGIIGVRHRAWLRSLSFNLLPFSLTLSFSTQENVGSSPCQSHPYGGVHSSSA